MRYLNNHERFIKIAHVMGINNKCGSEITFNRFSERETIFSFHVHQKASDKFFFFCYCRYVIEKKIKIRDTLRENRGEFAVRKEINSSHCVSTSLYHTRGGASIDTRVVFFIFVKI